MIKLDASNQEKLNEIFPDISDDDLFPFPASIYDDIIPIDERDSPYKTFLITVFDHMLSEEEAEKLLKPNNYEDEKKFLKFYERLYKKGDFYAHVESQNEEQAFYEFETLEELLDAANKSVKEEKFLKICLPKSETVLCGSYDYTIVAVYKVVNKLKELENLASDCKLFCIHSS